MGQGYAEWNLMLNQKVSTQPGFFISYNNYNASTPHTCGVTWNFSVEYIYSGGQKEPEYRQFLNRLKSVLEVETVSEKNFKNAFEYVLTMPPDFFLLNTYNPLPPPHPPSENATGSQNSVFVSRHAMKTGFADTMMRVLDICVDTLETPDYTSPDPTGARCGFHYLYTSVTGNLGS